MRFDKVVLGISFLLMSVHSYAETLTNSQVLNTQPSNTRVQEDFIGEARDWSLTDDEWARYLKLMQGPNGHWYPQLTPPEILGINADNITDETHFAEIVAKEEHDKLARELSFDTAIHEALLRLYGNEPVIQPFNKEPFRPLHEQQGMTLVAHDSLVVFENCSLGFDPLVLPKLLARISNNPQVHLDIFCVGDASAIVVNSFATLNRIPLASVREGNITLHVDTGQFQQATGGGSLPSVILVRNGQSLPVSLGGL